MVLKMGGWWLVLHGWCMSKRSNELVCGRGYNNHDNNTPYNMNINDKNKKIGEEEGVG